MADDTLGFGFCVKSVACIRVDEACCLGATDAREDSDISELMGAVFAD